MSGVVLGIQARVVNATIRNRRLELGLTQKQLAKLAGTSHSIVSHMETLRKIRLTPSARRVLEVLGLSDEASPDWLAELDLHGPRYVERSVTAELVANPQRLALPMPGDDESTDPAILFEENYTRELIRKAFVALPEREQAVLSLRFGLNGDGPWTYEAIGEELRMTRGRAIQLAGKGLKRLQKAKP